MSSIQQFYNNQTIFLTGATGFLGKLLLEKLLRICHDIEKIYVLVRPKYDKSQEERFKTIFEDSCFDYLKSTQPNFHEKIQLLSGDCSQPFLGLNEIDRNILKKEVTFVLHAAANVKFDMDLKTGINTNVRSVRDLLELMKEMERLRVFIYVSTAFSHCYKKNIDEEFYSVNINPEKLLAMVEIMDDKTLEILKPHILGEWPNTYVYTKAVAEELIRKHKQDLPVAIIRPAIVASTYEDPVAGWNDNFHGPVGIVVGVALGVLRTLHINLNLIARIVPADYVVNNILAIAWYIDKSKSENNKSRTTQKNHVIPIYNFSGSNNNLITWGRLITGLMKFSFVYPLSAAVWYYSLSTTSYKTIHKIRVFFFHTLFAHFVDCILQVVGKRPLAVEKYKKINKLIDTLSFFTTHSWNFSSNNVDNLWEQLDENDKNIFNFNMKYFDWDRYFEVCAIGGRIYLMKDPLETLPQARKKIYFLGAIHYIFIALIMWLLYQIFSPLFAMLF